MSTYVEGETTARGWRARKFYLSDAAIALLVSHCTGPRTMSSFLDDLIKRELDSPAERFLRGADQRETFTTQDGTVLPTAPEKRMSPDKLTAVRVRGGSTRLPAVPKQPTKKDFKLDDI